MLTSFGELPRFLRTARSLGLTVSVQRNLKLKQRRRGLDEASSLESFLALNAVGGECLEDFDVRRPSQGVLSGPEDSIRPSSQLPQSLTDGLWVDSTGPISESHVLA